MYGAVPNNDTATPARPLVPGTAPSSAASSSSAQTIKVFSVALLVQLVPEVHPRLWIAINHVLALVGCCLVIDLAIAQTQVSERRFASGFYLVFDFGTCWIWLMESGLSYYYQHYYLGKRNTPWYTKLELCIALYFVTTAAVSLWKWKIHHGDLAKDATNLWEVSLDTLSYIYLAIRSWKSGSQHDNRQDREHDPSTAGADEYHGISV